VLTLVEEEFGAWRSASADVDDNGPRLSVKVIVHERPEQAVEAVRARSTQDGRLILQTNESVAVVDPSRFESLAFVSEDLLAQEERFREQLLAAMTFALLAAFDRHPVHAAAIKHGGRAL